MIDKVYILSWPIYDRIDDSKAEQQEREFLQWIIKNNEYAMLLNKFFIDKFWSENVKNCYVNQQGEYKNIFWYEWYYKRNLQLLKELWINRKTSLLVCHGIWPNILIYAFIPFKMKVLRRHNCIGRYYNAPNKQKWILLFLLQKIFSKCFDFVFFVNDADKQEIWRLWYNGIPYFLPIPINTALWNDLKVDKINKNKIILTSIGRADINKNWMVIVQAVNKIIYDWQIEINLVWANTDKQYLNEIEEFCIKNNINLMYHWIKDHIFIKDLLHQTDIYIQPSFAEGQCQATMEAWLMWCPLILSDIETFKLTFQDFALFFAPTDQESLASQIDYMIKNIEFFKYKSLDIKDYIYNNRSLWKFNRQCENFYDIILDYEKH